MTDYALTSEELIKLALSGKHPERELIKNYNTYRTAHFIKLNIKKIIKMFKVGQKKAFNAYLAGIKAAYPDINNLISYTTFRKCQAYFEEELTNMQAMLDEYETYLADGHFVEQMIYLQERPIEEQFDYITTRKAKRL